MKDKVINSVKNFYKDLPFNFDEDLFNAEQKILQNPLLEYADLINVINSKQIKNTIEYGCGVGWLSSSLAYHYNIECLGIDMTTKALKRADEISKFLKLEKKLKFCESDIFDFKSKVHSTDLVVSIGVLHHTRDCHAAFKHILKSLKEGGYIFIGLYHKPSRVYMLEHFKNIVNTYGIDVAKIEYRAAHKQLEGDMLVDSWFQDQVLHPFETQHDFIEVYKWFKDEGIKFIKTSITGNDYTNDINKILDLEKKMTRVSYVKNILEKNFFPGFFTMLGQRC